MTIKTCWKFNYIHFQFYEVKTHVGSFITILLYCMLIFILNGIWKFINRMYIMYFCKFLYFDLWNIYAENIIFKTYVSWPITCIYIAQKLSNNLALFRESSSNTYSDPSIDLRSIIRNFKISNQNHQNTFISKNNPFKVESAIRIFFLSRVIYNNCTNYSNTEYKRPRLLEQPKLNNSHRFFSKKYKRNRHQMRWKMKSHSIRDVKVSGFERWQLLIGFISHERSQ